MLFRGDWRGVCSRVACSFSRCKRRDSRLYGESHSDYPRILVKSQINYTGRLADGRVFGSSDGREPLTFTIGKQALRESMLGDLAKKYHMPLLYVCS